MIVQKKAKVLLNNPVPQGLFIWTHSLAVSIA